MKKSFTIASILIVAALFVTGCRETVSTGRSTVQFVNRILWGQLEREAKLIEDFDLKNTDGTIAVVGDKELSSPLVYRLLHNDDFDNVDGRKIPDLLPDFSGETIDFIADDANAPYHNFVAAGQADSLRTLVVKNLIAAIDTAYSVGAFDNEMLSKRKAAKVVVFPSPYFSLYGQFDVDTLLRSMNKPIPVVFPSRMVIESLFDQSDKRFHMAVLTDETTAADGIHRMIFDEVAKSRQAFGSDCIAFARDTVGNVLTNFLDTYKANGGIMQISAIVIDDPDVDGVDLRASLDEINNVQTEENINYRKLIASDCVIIDTYEAVTDECFRIFRKNNIFTHNIAYPLYNGYLTINASRGNGYRLVATDKYVPDQR